jgi:hypothetical protein
MYSLQDPRKTSKACHVFKHFTAEWVTTECCCKLLKTALTSITISFSQYHDADPSSNVVYSIGLWPLACWDCMFKSRQGHECLPLVGTVVCCVPATGQSLNQGSPTECECITVCDLETSKTRQPRRKSGCCTTGEN